MTEELKQKAFNFLEKHTYYDECKGTHYRDLTEMELLVLFAEEATKELQEELKNRKDEWQEQVQKANDESYARTLQTIQLTKAKDLLLRFIELKDKPCASGHSVNMLLYENICADVKQFLNEVEK